MSERPISSILKDMFSKGDMKEKLFEARLTEKWKEITGPMIAQYTDGMYLKDKILYVKITSAPLKKELSMGKVQLLNIVNECLGEPFVREVILR